MRLVVAIWIVAGCTGVMARQAPDVLKNSIGIRLVRIPAGEFHMRAIRADEEEHPVRRVRITRPFFLGQTEVTNAQWKRVMGTVPSQWQDDDHPVESVSWSEAVEFCERLSALPEERRAGREYCLPTEAEWEYACQAGTGRIYAFGDDESLLAAAAWFEGNSGARTGPVGVKEANPWGLHDMHGNVREWCSDWYEELGEDAVTDPQGPARGSARIFRGSSWVSSARGCRLVGRGFDPPMRQAIDHGFRIAVSPPEAPVPDDEKEPRDAPR